MVQDLRFFYNHVYYIAILYNFLMYKSWKYNEKACIPYNGPQ